MEMPLTTGYASRFQAPEAVAAYEMQEYGPDSYASRMWELQQPRLAALLQQQQTTVGRPLTLLDFACGTGRVLAAVGPLVARAEGLDISPEMVAVAKSKCPRAHLRVADILQTETLPANTYDVITAFRFLLNVEPSVRCAVLARLRESIRQPDGVLLVNVHGNSHSLRHPALVWRRWRERAQPTGAMLNEMSAGETRALLRDTGFEVRQEFGFGLLPPTLYRTPLRGLTRALDKTLAERGLLREWSIDLLFVCRPA